jgi:hypothetical protein
MPKRGAVRVDGVGFLERGKCPHSIAEHFFEGSQEHSLMHDRIGRPITVLKNLFECLPHSGPIARCCLRTSKPLAKSQCRFIRHARRESRQRFVVSSRRRERFRSDHHDSHIVCCPLQHAKRRFRITRSHMYTRLTNQGANAPCRRQMLIELARIGRRCTRHDRLQELEISLENS